MKNTDSYWEGFITAMAGASIGIFICLRLGLFTNPSKKIPVSNEVQRGFVIPSKLEIKLQDLDGNGKKEVLMKYDGKNYLLTLDPQGKPRVQAYEVKPSEIVIKQ